MERKTIKKVTKLHFYEKKILNIFKHSKRNKNVKKFPIIRSSSSSIIIQKKKKKENLATINFTKRRENTIGLPIIHTI